MQNLIGRAGSEASAEAPIYGQQRIAGMDPAQQQAINQIYAMQGAQNGRLDRATDFYNAAADNNPMASAGPYMQAGLGSFQDAGNYGAQAASNSFFGTGSDAIGNALAAAQGITGAQQPYLNQAGDLIGRGTNTSVVGAASPYIQQGTQALGLSAAAPFLSAASQSLPNATMQNLSPYLGSAMDSLSTQAANDLKNKYLPAVNDDFIRAGQYGSTRNQDITAQTISDLERNVLAQQSQLLNQGYGQAQQAAGQNLALQGQLAGTAGGLGSAQQQALLGAGQTLGGLSGTQAGLQLQGAGQAGSLGAMAGSGLAQQAQLGISGGSALGALGTAQGNLQLGAGQLANQTATGLGQYGMNAGQLSNMQNVNRLNAGNAFVNQATAAQNVGLNDANALYSAGAQNQGLSQKSMDTAYQDWLNQTFYPQNQTSWLSNIVRGLPSTGAGYTTQTQVPSNTGAQVGGLLTAGLALSGGQGGGSGGSGGYGGYYRSGGKVVKFKRGGRVSYQRASNENARGGLGQFRGAA